MKKYLSAILFGFYLERSAIFGIFGPVDGLVVFFGTKGHQMAKFASVSRVTLTIEASLQLRVAHVTTLPSALKLLLKRKKLRLATLAS